MSDIGNNMHGLRLLRSPIPGPVLRCSRSSRRWLSEILQPLRAEQSISRVGKSGQYELMAQSKLLNRYRGGYHEGWEPSTHRRRSALTARAKFSRLYAAMILFCVIMYILIYNKAIYSIPKRAVTGWSINTNRDTKIYVKPNNITTIIQPKDICNKSHSNSKQKLFLLIVVCSSTKHFDRRKAIRDTWGNFEVYKKSYKIFTKVKEKYNNYNYTHDLYPKFRDYGVINANTIAINNITFSNINNEINERNDKVNDVTEINKHNDINYIKRSGVNRTKRDISSFNKLLVKSAKAHTNNLKDIKTEDDFEEHEKRFEDDEEPIGPEFDLNKEIGEEKDEDEETGNYDYESNIMKIPPIGNENTKESLKILNRLKITQMLDGVDSLEENVEPEFKIVFILGLPHKNDTDSQGKIEEESLKYGDIIQEDFIDSYYNLTLKSIMMLKWITNRCNDSVRYIMKTDDDMYINVPNLILDLKNRSRVFDTRVASKPQGPEYLLIGNLNCGAKPFQDTRDKWYTPRYMYAARVFPRFLSGAGYVLSAATARVLYRAALAASLFHLEDVFITGICSIRARPPQSPRDDPRFLYLKPTGSCWPHSHVTSHKFDQRVVADNLLDDEFVDRCERMWLTQVRQERIGPKAQPKVTNIII